MQLRGSRSGYGSLGLCLGMVALLGVAGCGPEGAGGDDLATVSSTLEAEAPEQDFPGDEEYTVCPSTEPDCDASFEDDEPVEVPDPPCTVPPCPLLPTDPGYKRWPGGVIPYVISSSVGATTKSRLLRAMTSWATMTNRITFRAKTSSDGTWFTITAGSTPKVSPHVGYKSGYNSTMYLRNPEYENVIRHELGHVMGFMHEVKSPLRTPAKVMIRTQYINSSPSLCPYQFSICSNCPTLNVAYNIRSIMHYRSHDMQVCQSGGNAIVLHPDGSVITREFNPWNITKGDVDSVNAYYASAGGCTAETNAQFCSRRGKNCGSVTGTDNCGATRTVASCGTCTAPAFCGGGTTANVCRLPPTVPTLYKPLTPVRLLDTRVANGLSGAFSASVPRTFQVAGRGGVPTNALAVTGNLTVLGTGSGIVWVGPLATSTPATSTLNFPANDTRSNGVTVQLGIGGTLSAVLVGGGTKDMIFDVTGYFADDATGNGYYPIAPTRVYDTRLTGAKWLSGQLTTFSVGFTHGGIVPGSAVAVTGTLAITSQTSAGYLALGVDTTSPPTSTINFPLGQTRATGVTLQTKGGCSGFACTNVTLTGVFKGATGATVDVIFDVTGYFAPATTYAGYRYVSFEPYRALDTRYGKGLGDPFVAPTPRTFLIPDMVGAAAVTGNLAVTGQTTSGYMAMDSVLTSTPPTSLLNYVVGDTRACSIDVRLAADGTTSAWNSAGSTHVIFDVTGYYRATWGSVVVPGR